MKDQLRRKILHIESTISKSKVQRILSRPLRYFIGQGIRHIAFPFFGWSRIKKIQSFYSRPFNVLLPGGLDLYLWGSKTHDSELRLTMYLIESLNAGDVFFDVGAHFGFYSGLASVLVGEKGSVFSFEPTPKTFEVLKTNIDSRNTQIFNTAIGSENGTIEFFEYDQVHSEYNSTVPVKGLSSKAYTVDLIRLDTFAKRHKQFPNIIKVDVEGAENEVVVGLEALLNEKNSLNIILEMFSNQGKNHKQLEASQKLQSCGFYPFQIKKDGSVMIIKELTNYLSKLSIESDNIVFMRP